MAQLRFPQPARARPEVRYVRPPEPLVFPEEEEVPEGSAHLIVRTFLYALLKFALGPEHSVGSDQFVYWNATDNKRELSPDVFVCLGVAQTAFGSWKTWEQGGVPELAVEIVSPNEGDGVTWEEKFARYNELGIRELVRFDNAEPEGHRLRAWDRVEGDLVEREIDEDLTPCLTLGLSWTAQMIPAHPGETLGLRLIGDDGRLLETRDESEARRRKEADEARAVAERAKEQEAQARKQEAEARAMAEARVRELEEQLRVARALSPRGPKKRASKTRR
jgi:Uma2 family endonuclease